MAVLPSQLACDKCGLSVPTHNDATFLEAFMSGDMSMLLFSQPRHLLPTEECEGSPSRAQYIEGQPRDTRGRPYDESREAATREAYYLMVKHGK